VEVISDMREKTRERIKTIWKYEDANLMRPESTTVRPRESVVRCFR